MNAEELVKKITSEVMERLNTSSYSDYNGSKIFMILTGADGVFKKALPYIEAILKNFEVDILLSKSAEHFISKEELRSYGANQIYDFSDFVGIKKAVIACQKIVIPLMTLNTASKVANQISDNSVTAAIIHALIYGKEIVVAKEGIEWCYKGRSHLCSGFVEKAESTIKTLKSFGIKVCNIENIIEGLSSINTNNRIETNNICTLNGDSCLACGLCIEKKTDAVNNILSAGATRIGATTGFEVLPENLAKFIDHTLLKPDAKEEQIIKLCEEAKKYGFASVCVNPTFVPLAAELLKGTDVKVCTVIGFPLGATTTDTKVFETKDAIRKGATEIDMVINVGALKAKNYKYVENDIRAVVEAAKPYIVKVIIETALLTDEEKIAACSLAKSAGAAFVKTSTGFGPGGATVEDVALMRKVVGKDVGVKASGGVRDYPSAISMVKAGATRIGASAGIAIVSGQITDNKGY